MNTIDRVCDWLANHELVGLALLVGAGQIARYAHS
jgi:hypothetical protein